MRVRPRLRLVRIRYRLRLLNGCDSRFLILQLDNPAVSVWQIGSDGGYLPSPVDVNGAYGGRLLLAPAERADIIVDFSAAAGQSVTLLNLGPDEPFGGGTPGVDFESADPASTGQVMRFNVSADSVVDPTTPAQHLVLPSVVPPGPEATVRRLSLNELESQTVLVSEEEGDIVHDPESGEAFGPVQALLGTLDEEMKPVPQMWSDPITENPAVGSTEVWEVYNFTMDAHPIHVHLVQFQVVNREGLMSMDGMAMQPAMLMGNPRGPEPGESGFKDTVIAYPGEVTRLAAKFDRPGLFVWHCHILSHEDNEMMRPFCVGSSEACMHSGMRH